MNEKGGIPSLEFAISALLFFALIGAGLLGFLTGNWIALKAIAGFIVVLIIYVVVLGFFEDLAYTRRKRSLYKDLVRLLKPAKKNKDTLAIEDTAKRIQNHKLFPTEFFNEAAKLVDLYRHVHSSQRAMARSILLRSIPFDLQTLALFLAIPVVDDMSETSFKRWLWGCKPDVLEIFQSCLEDISRNDHAVLLALFINLTPKWATPEYAAVLKPFRPHLEAHYEKITGSDHEQLDSYVKYWVAEDADATGKGG